MNKEFVPYELSKQLKEIGFDEPCLAYYTLCHNELMIRTRTTRTNSELKNVTAPLWQQVITWFREVHDIHVTIDFSSYGKYFYHSYDTSEFTEILLPEPVFNTYEEALKDVVKHVIKKIKTRILI